LRVLCFGELLWDFLPAGIFPGGAPFNVAYHLHHLGLDAAPVSCLGADSLGDELRMRLEMAGIPVHLVGRHPDLPTGRVRAVYDAEGEPHYEIADPAAWDEIPAHPALDAAPEAAALVFGTLALRRPANRATLAQLLDALPADAVRVFDVNLRPPHDDPALVREFAARATLLKVNEAEARRLVPGLASNASPGELAAAVADAMRCACVCLTAGARGAGWHEAGSWYWEPAEIAQGGDPVGAGDAFLAGFLARHLLAPGKPQAALETGCRLGAWVASQRGATPAYPA
jgi:fructokinase